MENIELLLTVNALLVSVLGIGMSLLSFFLKDVYRDHKKLQDQVHLLKGEVKSYQRLYQEQIRMVQKQSERNREQMDWLRFRWPLSQ
ncbi:MAG: hypothetical protein AAF944_08280 [Bacteroidota bacterium]